MNEPLITCTKRYGDLPFAHRQPKHGGHCSFIHGHSWAFEFEFAAHTRDACGFVVDFGALKPLRDWIEERFDHTLVLNHDDPWLAHLKQHLAPAFSPGVEGSFAATLAKIVEVPDCSSEGIAEYLLYEVNLIIEHLTHGRAFLKRVTVFEDSRNSATALAHE